MCMWGVLLTARALCCLPAVCHGTHRGNDPTDFAGLILVKEVLQFWRCPETPRVSQLSLRPCPRLPADTPMFDMLRFFQVCGGSESTGHT